MRRAPAPLLLFRGSGFRAGRARPAKDAPHFTVAALTLDEIAAESLAWSRLQARAIEPNGFLEQGFALAVARHLPQKSRPRFVAVWATDEGEGEGEGRLVGLFPLGSLPGFVAPHSLWLHDQAALATPLVDRDCAVAAIGAFLDDYAARNGAGLLLFPKIVEDGPFHLALKAALAESGRAARLFGRHRRAALRAGGDPETVFMQGASTKAMRELDRRRRRLEEIGAVSLEVARTPAAIKQATEAFLALEAAGWKKRRGALLSDPALTAFARSAMRLLAFEGKAQAVTLRCGGRAAAIGLVLESGANAYFWKIAFDESLRAQAPGVALTRELTALCLAQGRFDIVDSCAIADHPMIDRCWPERIAICDVAAQLDPARPASFREACAREGARRELRAFAKRSVNRALGRKVS